MTSKNNSKYPLVSVVTVNYDHSQDTIEFLDSLKKFPYPNIECIVVDNGSRYEDPDIIKQKHPEINFVKIKKNIGFAPANNIGIKQAKGEYILSINNDVIVTKDFLFPLVQKLQENSEIALVAPKICFYYGSQNIQSTGFTEINPLTIRNKGIGCNEPDEGKYNKDSLTPFVHGAAMLFQSKLVDEVGLMSEYFFLYYEDMDWCKRIRNAGYKISYVHNSCVYHKDGVTNEPDSPLKTYYLNRGRLIYMRRHVKFPMIIASILYMFLFALPKNFLLFLFKRQFAQSLAYLKAYSWFVTHLFDTEMTSLN